MLALLIGARPAQARPVRAAVPLAAQLDSALAGGRVAEARAAAESLASLRERSESADTLAAWLDGTAVRFFALGEPPAFEAAEALFSRALFLRERAHGPSHLDVARSLGTLSILDDRLGRPQQAIPYGRRALEIRMALRGEGDTLVAASERQLGVLYFETGRYAGADTLFARARAAWEARGPGYEKRTIDALVNCAEAARVLDRGEVALALLQRALGRARASLPPDDPLVALVVNNLAGLYKDRGRYSDAEPLLLESLRRRLADPSDSVAIATGLLNLGELYRLQDRPAEAETLYVQSVAIAKAALPPNDPDLAWYLNQFGVFLREQGELERAERFAREALEVVQRSLGDIHPLYAQGLHELGDLLLAEGRRSEAETAYRHALAIRDSVLGRRHPDAVTTRVALAGLLMGATPDDSAAYQMINAVQPLLGSTFAYPEVRLEALGTLARLGWRSGSPVEGEHAVSRIAASKRAAYRSAAIDTMSTVLASMDTLRMLRGGSRSRAAFLARHLDYSHQLVGWLLERGEVARAIETHERARARVLLDDMNAAGVDPRTGVPPEALAPLERDERAAGERLAQAQRALDDLRERWDLAPAARFEQSAALAAARDSAEGALERTRDLMREQSPVWRAVLGRTVPPTFAQLQRTLVPRHGKLLIYHVGADASLLFVVPPAPQPPLAYALTVDSAAAKALDVSPGALTSQALRRIVLGGGRMRPGQVGLADLLSGHREMLPPQRPGAPDLLESRLHALWRVLVPAAAWRSVERAAEVVVIPDGALHQMPFEALVTHVAASGHGERYWLDDGPAVRYGASASSLVALASRAAPHPQGALVLSVSDPAFTRADAAPAAPESPALTRDGGGPWPALPGARRESETIRAAFPVGEVLVRQDRDADEAQVRALLPGRRYLHFATHGFVSEGASGLLGGLVLAAPAQVATGTENDGVLQLFEIYGLHLDCDLAVLSACETQRGLAVEGEGVLALSRGFLTAGAGGVVASLWAVSDASTAEIVGGLFRRIAAADARHAPANTAIALRDARRDVRAHPEWSDPFHWAPFIYTGR